jgi:hypothetical protein
MPRKSVPPDWRPKSLPRLGHEPKTNLDPAKRENLRMRQRSGTLTLKLKARQTPGLSLWAEVQFSRLGGFRLHIDDAFRDLS